MNASTLPRDGRRGITWLSAKWACRVGQRKAVGSEGLNRSHVSTSNTCKRRAVFSPSLGQVSLKHAEMERSTYSPLLLTSI